LHQVKEDTLMKTDHLMRLVSVVQWTELDHQLGSMMEQKRNNRLHKL